MQGQPGRQRQRLIADLDAEFADAERLRDDEGVGYWTERIIAYLEGWQPDLNLPLDLRATAFQIKVWQQLQRIPVGETRHYSEIAAAIGQPKAVRAVANACASNPTALVIPCHRVIRKDRSLGGYRWGIERKRALLEGERRLQRGSQRDALGTRGFARGIESRKPAGGIPAQSIALTIQPCATLSKCK